MTECALQRSIRRMNARTILRALRAADYGPTVESMRRFTATRGAETPDEIWLVEHPPVYTLGLAGRLEHVGDVGDVPVVRTERGGQVTYHGPGQVVAYPLLDLRRRALTARCLVERLEQAAIDTCASFDVAAVRRKGAPGVYLADASGAKLASVGVKISRGCSFHGVALNASMDLAPFGRIDPCGYAGQPMTDLARASARPDLEIEQVAARFAEALLKQFP